MRNKLTIAMVAGEVSGDNLGAPLIKALRTLKPDIECVGIGGPGMLEQGFQSWFPMDRLSVNGFIDPLKRLPELLGILVTLRRRFLAEPPAVFVGIDFNFFNLLLEGMLHKQGIPTVHYVSPTVWAWRSSRIKRIARNVDLMLTLYPFETQIYRDHGVDVCFVGHPKADEFPLDVDVGEARRQLGLTDAEEVLAILPGSRSSEIRYSAPDFLKAAAICREKIPDLKLLIPCVNAKCRQQIHDYRVRELPELPVQLIDGRSEIVMRAADVVLVNSGTATLEALLLKKPMVMSYRLGPLTYAIVSRLTRINYFALPNILSGKRLIPEYIQGEATPDVLAAAVLEQLSAASPSDLIADYRLIHQELRRGAAVNAAQAILGLVEKASVQSKQ